MRRSSPISRETEGSRALAPDIAERLGPRRFRLIKRWVSEVNGPFDAAVAPYAAGSKVVLDAGCSRGDPEACERLIRRFSSLVYRSVQHVLITRHVPFANEDLKDVHNMVFLKLFEHGCRKLKQYRGKNGCSLSTWLRIVTVRTVLNHLRDSGKEPLARDRSRLSLEDLPELEEDTGDAWTFLERAEQEALVRRGMRVLSPRDRLFIKLHFEEGFSLKEVADTMNLSVANAYTVKHRSVQRLKSCVESFLSEE